MSALPGLDSVREAASEADAAVRTNYLIGPKAARPTRVELLGVPPKPKMIVDGYLQQDATGTVAPGSTGKSTVLVYEAVHIILGRPLYDREIVRSGGALIVTAEDKREDTLARLNHICKALKLNKSEQTKVLRHFYVEDVSAMPAKLVQTNQYGVEPTAFADEIIDKYAKAKLAVVTIDPTSLLGPGEQSGNDGMAQFMRTARRLSIELGAATRVVHHVSQQVARSNIRDQFAGRGATAFADNSRGIHQLVRLTGRKIDHEGCTYTVPAEVTDERLASGNVLAIFVHKLSYVERDPTPIILVRDGFAFHHVPVARLDKSPVAEMRRRTEHCNEIIAFLWKRLTARVKTTSNELDGYASELSMTRRELREARDLGLQMGLITEELLPPGERRTNRKRFLVPSGTNPANPAIPRRNAASGITYPATGVAGNPAADGSFIRRRESTRKKGQKKRATVRAVLGQSRQVRSNPIARPRRLNGQQYA